MQTETELSMRDIEVQFARAERQSRIITVAIAAVVSVGAALFLLFTYNKLQSTHKELQSLSTQLQTVRSDLTVSEQQLKSVNEERTKTQQQLKDQASELDRVTTQLSARRQEADALKQQVDQANAKLRQITDQLAATAGFDQYLHPIDPADAKNLFNTSPALGGLLVKILSLRDRNLKFDFANRPEVGFTSPGFAGYVLQSIGEAPEGMPPDAALRTLESTSNPVLGDIILYETGFALFYLKDRHDAPFVIGMTPLGIAALNLDFNAKRIGALHTNVYTGPRR